jgi:hypothetical protein
VGAPGRSGSQLTRRVSSLKGNGIAILSVLLSSTSCICVKVIAECTFQFSYISTLSLVYSSFPRCLYQRRWRERCFPKKQKKEVMKSKSMILEAQCRWLPEKNKTQCLVQKKRKRRRTERGTLCVEGGTKDDCATSRSSKSVFLNISRIRTGKSCETLSKTVLRHTPRVLSRRRQD